MNTPNVQASAAARDKQIGRDRVAKEFITPCDVVGQNRACGWMDRYQPPLAELGASDRQDRMLEVHIGDFKVQRFRQAHACDAEQADQSIKNPGT